MKYHLLLLKMDINYKSTKTECLEKYLTQDGWFLMNLRQINEMGNLDTPDWLTDYFKETPCESSKVLNWQKIFSTTWTAHCSSLS
jgi:hypothetical protein